MTSDMLAVRRTLAAAFDQGTPEADPRGAPNASPVVPGDGAVRVGASTDAPALAAASTRAHPASLSLASLDAPDEPNPLPLGERYPTPSRLYLDALRCAVDYTERFV